MRNSFRFGIATAALIASVQASPVLAQAEPAPPPAPQDQSQGIQDIVVTARRNVESAQKVPLSISVFGAQQLKDANVQGLSDIASATPNFYVQTSSADPTGVLLTIRGQSQQYSILTTDSPVGVYVDGVNYIRSSNLDSALVDIERVEVLKGPQGTLYGKNTTGGAVSITTKQPVLDALGGYVTLTGGNRDRRDALGVLNVPIVTDVLGVRVVAQRTEHGSYGTNGLGEGIGDKRQIAFRTNVLFKPNDDVRFALSADYTRTRSNGPLSKLSFVSPFPSPAAGSPNPAPGLLQTAIEGGLLNPALLADPAGNGAAIGAALAQAQAVLAGLVGKGSYYDNSATSPQSVYARTYGVSANLAVDLAPWLQFRSISGIRWLNRSEDVDLDSTPFNLLSARLASRARNMSQEIQFASQGNKVFDWILGAYVNEEKGHELSNAIALPLLNPANPNTTEGDVNNTSWAVFGQSVISLTDTLRATVGLRWTEEGKELVSFNRAGPTGAICSIPTNIQQGGCRTRFNNSFSDYSYLASVDWQAQQGVLLYARTGRGFKGGGQNLRGTGNSSAFLPFAPEIVTDYEVGFKTDFFNRKLRVNGDIFYADYKNIQRTVVQASSSGSIISLITNAAKARIQGAELEVTAAPVDGLTLTASGGITDAKYNKFIDATGDRSNEPFQFPKYTYALTASYWLPTGAGKLRFAADWNWRSATQLVGSAIYRESLTQKAYGLLGARVSLTVDAIDADVAVFAKNATNRKYAVSGVQFDNSLGFNTLYAGEPRLFGIEFTKRLGRQ